MNIDRAPGNRSANHRRALLCFLTKKQITRPAGISPLSASPAQESAAMPFSRSFGSLHFFSRLLSFFTPFRPAILPRVLSPPRERPRSSSASSASAAQRPYSRHKSLRKICQVEQNEAARRLEERPDRPTLARTTVPRRKMKLSSAGHFLRSVRTDIRV